MRRAGKRNRRHVAVSACSGAADHDRVGRRAERHRRVLGLALSDFIDQDHDFPRVMQLLRYQAQDSTPVEGPWIGNVSDGKANELFRLGHQELAQSKDDELRWIVANVDDQSLRALRRPNIVGGIRRAD